MEKLIHWEGWPKLRDNTNRNKGNICWLWTACRGDRAAKGKRLQSRATAVPSIALFAPFFPISRVSFLSIAQTKGALKNA